MRIKIAAFLNKLYGTLMSISFFAGFIPFFPFIFAIIVGGELGETISVFLYKQYYPWVIVAGSAAIILGLISMYLSGEKALSADNNKKESK